jgi:hypothetical protein
VATSLAEVLEELPEALAAQGGGRDLAALVGLPQTFVDLTVGLEDRARIRQAEAAQRAGERNTLRAVRIEQRMVEVEEDGAGRGQGRKATWRGR